MLESFVTLALAALVIEALVGYPDAVYRVIGHPVTWMGRLIGALDRLLNRTQWSFEGRRAAGVAALAILLGVTAVVALSLAGTFARWPGGWLLTMVAAASLPAQRSLHDHVKAVADALDTGGLEAGRKAVSMIVGRNPASLDEAGVCRAAIESLAENFSDGVVAPAVWTAVGGLAGGALYKAANTADSMIGHRTPKHEAFGWAAARFDDLINLPASRFSAVWLLAAASMVPGASVEGGWKALLRDAGRHRSPNAGWPESVVAGALGLKLAGPRVYGETRVEDAYMGDGRREATVADIRRALILYRVACAIQATALAVLVLVAL
jgi:adenosylcobinamide-phosphate synthase